MTNSPGFSRRGQWRGCSHLVGRPSAGGACDVTVTPPAVAVCHPLRQSIHAALTTLRLPRGPPTRAIRVTHWRGCATHVRPRVAGPRRRPTVTRDM